MKMVKKVLITTGVYMCIYFFKCIHVYTHISHTDTEDGKKIVDEYRCV